jgi:lysophospholipase L1-like esterase
MNRGWLAALLLLFTMAPWVSQATNLATAPIGREDLPWWQTRFEQTLAAARAEPDAKIVWLGDSITQYWQREGTQGYDNIMPVWQEYYAPYDALDFGFVGDTTSSLIWRLDHGQVDGLHPRLVIILIGANNLGRVHWGAAMTIPGIEAVVADAHQRLPGAHILLLGILPSIRSPWVDQQTVAINAALAAAYAHNAVVTFVDAGPVFSHAGRIDPGLFVDPKQQPPAPALHPDAEGMARLAAFIQADVERYARSQ